MSTFVGLFSVGLGLAETTFQNPCFRRWSYLFFINAVTSATTSFSFETRSAAVGGGTISLVSFKSSSLSQLATELLRSKMKRRWLGFLALGPDSPEPESKIDAEESSSVRLWDDRDGVDVDLGVLSPKRETELCVEVWRIGCDAWDS